MFWIGMCAGVVVGFAGFILLACRFIGSADAKHERKHQENANSMISLLAFHERKTEALEILAAHAKRREG